MKHQCEEGYKLVKKHHHLVLESSVPKILCFSTAFDDTYVFSKVIHPGADESIVHVDKHGQVLFEKKYPDIINFFGMLNDDQVILMYVPENHIDLINLRTKTTRSIHFNYLYDDVAQMSIETFYDTRMFCIIQKGTFNEPKLRINYFKQQDYKNNAGAAVKSCSEYISVDNIWTYECPVKRVNDKSKIGWFRYKHESHIEFYIYSLDNNPKGALQLIKIKNTIGEPYGINNAILSLATLWQADGDSYLLVGSSNKQQNGKNPEGVTNNNYIVNVKDGTVRETAFYFKDPTDNFAWNDQIIEYFSLGDISVFHTFRHQAGKTMATPVFYIDNKKEQIVDQETWQATCYVNFFFPGFAKNTVIEGFYENGDVKQVGVTTKSVINKMIDPRIISMFFMLHINEDFDDDLLSDAIDLLHG